MRIVLNKTEKLDETLKTEQLSNEELASLIQKGEGDTDKYWYMLYNQTKECIYNVYHKRVHSYYKNNYKEDILSILKIGWTKAVNTFDNTKCKWFVSWAMLLMEREYINFAKRRTSEREGRSIRTECLGCLNNSFLNSQTNKKALNETIDNILIDEYSEEMYNNFEIKELVDQKMKMLKKYHPVSYEMIIDSFYNGRTQTQIAEDFNIKQVSVSRYIKIGKNFLRDVISTNEKEACLYTK